MTVDITTTEKQVESYWRPTYSPEQIPYSEYIDTFVELIQTAVRDRLYGDKKVGLLLSGGSDSRLILAAADNNISAHHMADWMNREAKIAKKVADIADIDFRLLKRQIYYQSEAVKKAPKVSNFISNFQQSHIAGFQEEFKNIESIITGQFGDTLFKGHFLPVPEIPVGTSSIDFPFEQQFTDIKQYISHISESTPEYIQTDSDIEEILYDNIQMNDGKINNHGIQYDSIRHMTLCSAYYPLTNQPDYFSYGALVHLANCTSPFIDNRLLDLHLKTPVKYFLRRNIINDALERLNPSLADIPHPNTGQPLSRSYPFHYFGQKFRTLIRKTFKTENRLDYDYYTQRAWPDHDELLRTQDFGKEEIVSV